MDPSHWLAPAGVAVITATLLRKYRRRARGVKKSVPVKTEAARAAETVREAGHGWTLKLHDAGREAEASLATRAAELTALERSADAAADRLRVFAPDPAPDAAADAVPADGDAAVRRHLRQAGYDEGQIDVLLGRGGEAVRRVA